MFINKIFLFCLVFLGLTGCAEIVPMRSDQAAQIDFGTFYMKSLSAKYQPKDPSTNDGPEFSEKLAFYDSLATSDLDVNQKKEDAESKLKALSDIRVLTNDISSLEAEISYCKTLKTLEEEKISFLNKKIMSTSKPLEENQFQSIKDSIDEHRRVVTEIDAKITKNEVNKLLLKSELESRAADIKNLGEKKYETAELKRKSIRDEIIRDFIAIADHNYMHFKNDLLAGRVRSDTIGDISELLLSSATTLTGGVMAKTNLGAASTLLKGSRATIDKNFFAQQTMRAIINAMEQGRASDRKIIVEKMVLPTAQYPISEAISDVQRYQSRASLFLAVLDLANQSGTSAGDAENELNKTVKKAVESTKSTQ